MFSFRRFSKKIESVIDHQELVKSLHITQTFAKDSYNNIPPNIWNLTKRRVFDNPAHPIATLNHMIQDYF